MKTNLMAAAVLLAVSPVFQLPAQAADTSDYYKIKSESVSVTEVSSGKAVNLERPQDLAGENKSVGAAAMINTGIAAWNVVSGGAPSGAASAAYASALPPAIFLNWSSVAGWQGPKEYVYAYTVTNLYNIDVIKVKYKIAFHYGGTEDYLGRPLTKDSVTGKYLTNFTVKAVSVDVKWGWHFNLDAVMSNPMNIGTTLKPVAFLQSDLKWSVSNMLSTRGGVWTYSADGEGNFLDLTAQQKALTEAIPPVKAAEAPAMSWN